MFLRLLHGIKRGHFWQRQPTHTHIVSSVAGCSVPSGAGWRPRMCGGPTRQGDHDDGQRVHATDAGGGSPLRTPDPLLEPQDVRVHLRRAQQDPHHQPREDAAALRGSRELHQEHRFRWRHRAVRRNQAFGARAHPEGSHPRRHAVRQSALARRHAHQLQDGAPVDQASRRPHRDEGQRFARQARQERRHHAASRDGQARAQPGWHQGHGAAAGCAVRGRCRPREDRDPRSQQARHPDRRHRRHQLLAGRRRLCRPGQR